MNVASLETSLLLQEKNIILDTDLGWVKRSPRQAIEKGGEYGLITKSSYKRSDSARLGFPFIPAPNVYEVIEQLPVYTVLRKEAAHTPDNGLHEVYCAFLPQLGAMRAPWPCDALCYLLLVYRERTSKP